MEWYRENVRRARAWLREQPSTHIEGLEGRCAAQVENAPARASSLRRNFSWTFLGNGVYNACQWGLIVVLAKLGSPELVGRYSLAVAVTAPAFMLSNMSLATILTADATDRNRFGEYLGLRLVLSAMCLVAIAAAVWSGSYGADVSAVVALVTLAKFAESVSDVAYGLMQKHERMDLVARSMMAKGVLSLGAVAAVLQVTGSLALGVGALCFVWTGLLVGYDLPRVRTWSPTRPHFGREELLRLLWLSLPLGVVAALNSLSAQIPRYAMEHWFGERELGIFSAIFALGMMVRMVTLALSRSALPRLSRHFARGELRQFQRLIGRLVAIGAAVGAVSVLLSLAFGRAILEFVYTHEYAERTDVLVVTVLGMALVATFNFLGSAATAAQRFRPQVVVHIFKCGSIAAICAVVVPRWGAVGAAWAQVGGTVVSCAAYGIILAQVIRQARPPASTEVSA